MNDWFILAFAIACAVAIGSYLNNDDDNKNGFAS